MSLTDTFTSLMNAARQEYDLNHKIGFAELTKIIKPNPNLAKGTDDYSGNLWGYYVPTDVTDKFNGLTVKAVYGGAHIGPIVTVPAGDYTYSFFVKPVDKIGNFYAKARGFDFTTMQENANTQSVIAGAIKGTDWQRVSFTFKNIKAGSYVFMAENWPGTVWVAGQKVESGPYTTPYYAADNRLITAPEVGGVTSALYLLLLPNLEVMAWE